MSSNSRWFLDTLHMFSFKAEHEIHVVHSNSKDSSIYSNLIFISCSVRIKSLISITSLCRHTDRQRWWSLVDKSKRRSQITPNGYSITVWSVADRSESRMLALVIACIAVITNRLLVRWYRLPMLLDGTADLLNWVLWTYKL